MKSIIQIFSEHGTFVQPDSLDYILSKENPEEFTTYLTKELKEYPLVLTLDHIKSIENKNENKKISTISDDFIKNKKIQSKILSDLYNNDLKPNKNFIEKEEDQLLINQKELLPCNKKIQQKVVQSVNSLKFLAVTFSLWLDGGVF